MLGFTPFCFCIALRMSGSQPAWGLPEPLRAGQVDGDRARNAHAHHHYWPFSTLPIFLHWADCRLWLSLSCHSRSTLLCTRQPMSDVSDNFRPYALVTHAGARSARGTSLPRVATGQEGSGHNPHARPLVLSAIHSYLHPRRNISSPPIPIVGDLLWLFEWFPGVL